jgi:DNA-binding XRE family transcriptional regulator
MATAQLNVRDTFINNMRKLRLANNLTQVQFSERLKISRHNVADWETHKCFPPIEVTIKISDMFRVDLRQMLTEDLKKDFFQNNISA